MKVLILASDFQTGGITASMINFVCELTRRGHKVDILNMSGETVPVDLLEVSEIIELHGIAKYWNLNFERIREASGVFRKIMLLLFGLIKKLLNRSDMWHKLIFKKQPIIDGYDLAIAYRQFAPCYYFALNKTAAKTKIAFVHCFLDDDDDIGSWELYLRYFDKIACVSDAVKDALIKRQPQIKESAFTVYNMFDPIKINMLSGVYKSLFDPKCFNIVTVTRLGREKCVDRIPEICIMLMKAEINFCWYVIGSGPLENYLRAQTETMNLNSCLKLLGEYQNPFPYVSDADITVLPSEKEAYGMVATESLILGVPAVVTEYQAAFEIIDNGKNGLIVPNSSAGLYKAIYGIITDRGKYGKLKKGCLEYRYDREKPYNQLMEAIHI